MDSVCSGCNQCGHGQGDAKCPAVQSGKTPLFVPKPQQTNEKKVKFKKQNGTKKINHAGVVFQGITEEVFLCETCEIPVVRRVNSNVQSEFWGCQSFSTTRRRAFTNKVRSFGVTNHGAEDAPLRKRCNIRIIMRTNNQDQSHPAEGQVEGKP